MTEEHMARIPQLHTVVQALSYVTARYPGKRDYSELYDEVSKQLVRGRLPDKDMLVEVLDLVCGNTERAKKEADQYLTGRLTDVREKMQAVDDKLHVLLASVLQDYVGLALERNKPKANRLEAVPIEVLKVKYLRLSDRLREMRALITLAIPGEQVQATQPTNQPSC